ncbi:MAG TPA: hypothetical protein VEK55_12610 [Xanthobacteraceae bacterium]|nr:hypothetical protein [Xanthobacteraceae bacterium]
MGRKELKQAAEELKPLGSIVLTAVFAPLYGFYVLFFHLPVALLMVIFGPLLRYFFGPKDDAPPHRENTERAPQNLARAPARRPEVTSARDVGARDDDPLDRWADDGGAQ